jgi:hypothetical protein
LASASPSQPPQNTGAGTLAILPDSPSCSCTRLI